MRMVDEAMPVDEGSDGDGSEGSDGNNGGEVRIRQLMLIMI